MVSRLRTGVVVFPGSNCDRDTVVALRRHLDASPCILRHGDREIPELDLVVLPGGFSYGDYLRSGAIAARAPVMEAVDRHVSRGGKLLAICNGFQIATERGYLPGSLAGNAGRRFVSRLQTVRVTDNRSPFTCAFREGQVIRLPVAHAGGCYVAGEQELQRLEREGLVAFRYCDAEGHVTPESSPSGSAGNIAGILDRNRRVLGLMPHPERAADPEAGKWWSLDGCLIFRSLLLAAQQGTPGPSGSGMAQQESGEPSGVVRLHGHAGRPSSGACPAAGTG